MSERQRGIYRKYEVHRTDGSSKVGGKHHGCEYFVLDLNHDPFALPALSAYADACEDTYPTLARQLRRVVSGDSVLNKQLTPAERQQLMIRANKR